MIPRPPCLSARLSVVVALLIALTSSGFAHRVAAQPLDDAMIAYVAAGGSLSDLCGDGAFGSGVGTQGCDACRLVDAAALCAAVTQGLMPFHAKAGAVAWPLQTTGFAQALDLSRPVRAPPFV